MPDPQELWRNEPVTPFTGFKGLNNRISPYSLGAEWSAELVNVDVLDSGGYQLRPGYTMNFPLEDLYVTRDYNHCFGVTTDKKLVELELDLNTQVPFIKRELYANVGEGFYYFADAGHITFFMGRTTTLAINNRAEDNKVVPWGAPVPDITDPEIIDGNLYKGTYTYTLTYTHIATGLESGALTYRARILENNKGLRFTLPQIPDYKVNVYISYGPLPHLVASTTEVDFIYTEHNPGAIPVRTLSISGPPIGKALGYWRGSIYVGVHNIQQGFSRIYRSQASRYHWFRRGEDSPDIIDVPGEIILLADCPIGLVIGTDREVYLRNLDNETIPLRNYGVVRGRWDWDKRGRVYFATPRGICSVGEGDAYFIEHTSENFSGDFGSFAIVNILETGGVERVITTVIPSGIIYNQQTIFDTTITEHDLTGA